MIPVLILIIETLLFLREKTAEPITFDQFDQWQVLIHNKTLKTWS